MLNEEDNNKCTYQTISIFNHPANFFKSCKKWFENCPATPTIIIKALFVENERIAQRKALIITRQPHVGLAELTVPPRPERENQTFF